MSFGTSQSWMLCFLLATSPTESSLLARPEPAGPEIFIERIERVSRDEVHFSLRITDKADQPVFLTGIKYDSGAKAHPVYLEQWRPKEGWKSYFCMDMPPPDVIKLNPREAITQVLWWKLPMSAVCKNPITTFEGKFRFRLEYFESEKQARAYVKKLFSRRWQEARAAVALSEPFEIPPPPGPKQ